MSMTGRYTAGGSTVTTGAVTEVPFRVDANGIQYVRSDSLDALADVTNGVGVFEQGQYMYETLASGSTDQVMGVTGAAGDMLHKVIVIPQSLSPGACSIKDGSGSAITIFAGGASSLTELRPIVVELNTVSTSGAWKVTTGASMTAIGIGRFTP